MLEIEIKYLEGAQEIEKLEIGDWIDLRSNEDIFIAKGSSALVHLGVCMKLPEGYEAILAPRSSTFRKWGILQTNSIGVIDNSYSGNEDEWMMPVYCVNSVCSMNGREGTYIRKGDRICQFRIQQRMPEVTFVKVRNLQGDSRGGFGSTGTN